MLNILELQLSYHCFSQQTPVARQNWVKKKTRKVITIHPEGGHECVRQFYSDPPSNKVEIFHRMRDRGISKVSRI